MTEYDHIADAAIWLPILKNNLLGLLAIKYKQTFTFNPQSKEKQTKGLLYEY